MSKTFDRNTWYRAIIKYGEDDLVKFIIQQNYIHGLLQKIISLRTKLIDKKLINQIEGKTLGQLKSDFQLLAKYSRAEAELLKKIEAYNVKRNKIIHKLFMIDDDLISNISLKHTINKGQDIIKQLDSLVDIELKKIQ